jgi:hypothetical protein
VEVRWGPTGDASSEESHIFQMSKSDGAVRSLDHEQKKWTGAFLLRPPSNFKIANSGYVSPHESGIDLCGRTEMGWLNGRVKAGVGRCPTLG